MASPPDWTTRIAGRVNLPLLANQLVAVVGVGTVGSQVSRELARAGVVRQLLIDYDSLKPENFPRHALGKRYELMNKAEAMAVYLEDELGQTAHRVAPLLVRDDLVSDSELTELFTGVDLVVAATGDPRTQRRLANLALQTWGVPALFPAITGPFDGEVFVQLDRDFPCFHCWHLFRDENAGADAVTALNIDAALGIVGLTTSLALGLLDDSADTDLLTPEPQGSQPQLFVQTRRAFAAKRVRRRHNCPSCGGRQEVIADPVWMEPSSTPPGLEHENPWPTPPPLQEPTPGSPHYHAAPSTPLAPSQGKPRDRTGILALVVLAAIVVFFLLEAATTKHLPAEISQPTSIYVNYHEPLARMIEATHLLPNMNFVPITEKQFPVTSGPAEVEVVSISLTDVKASEVADNVPPNTELAVEDERAASRAAYREVQHKLRRFGYRPATLPELLAYLAQNSSSGEVARAVMLAGRVYHGENVICGVSASGDLRCTTVAEGFSRTAEVLAVKK